MLDVETVPRTSVLAASASNEEKGVFEAALAEVEIEFNEDEVRHSVLFLP